MEVMDVSQINLTESILSRSAISESSQLLNSRLSNSQMQSMGKENLLIKLLDLYQALENTQRDNQMLRIEKAQLRTQLKKCKTKAEQFIQSNIQAAKRSLTNVSNQSNHKVTIYNSAEQSIQNTFMTPFESEDEDDKNFNKVFVKTHRRGISNNCITSQHQILLEQKKYYNTLMNSPKEKRPIRIPQTQNNRTNLASKISFPKNKINELIEIQRQYEEREEEDLQNHTLENFESFYCHKKQKSGQVETARRGASLPKNNVYLSKRPEKDNFVSVFEKRLHTEQFNPLQKCMNKSISSSNISRDRECGQKGFKIPSSIEEIWGSSNSNINSKYINEKVNITQNRTSKLTKVNVIKSGPQRKSYLNC